MAFNAGGVFARLYNWVADRDAGINITASRMDAETDGIVQGLNQLVDGTQPFKAPVRSSFGTAATPGHSFDGDINTGMYRPAEDQIGHATNGVQRTLLTTTGYQVDVPMTGTAVTSSATDTTAGRLLIVGAGHQQLDATLYRKGNIVGTVSQSGGVPTGAVFETGSNANGEFVRFANGTQICTISQISSSATADTTWTFPAAFVYPASPSRPVITGNAATTAANGWRFAGGGVANGTSFDFSALDKTDARVAAGCSIIAIGRWY